LDVSGDFHVKEDSRVLTRREIMEALLYVDRAHAKTIHKKNTNAQKWVRRWKAEKFSEDLLNTLFVVIVSRTLKFVNGIRQLNVRAVAELQELL